LEDRRLEPRVETRTLRIEEPEGRYSDVTGTVTPGRNLEHADDLWTTVTIHEPSRWFMNHGHNYPSEYVVIRTRAEDWKTRTREHK